MDPITRPTAHMKHSVFQLPGSQGRKMDKSGGNSHRIHLPHQGADLSFIPEDIGELAAYIVVGDAPTEYSNMPRNKGIYHGAYRRP